MHKILKKINKIILVILCIFPSKVKIFFLKFIYNANIGRNVKIGFGTILICDKIHIGNSTKIGKFNFIMVNNFNLGSYVNIENSNTVTGNNITLKSRCIISSKVQIRGELSNEDSNLKMGMNSWIFESCYLDLSRSINLGRNVGLGGRSLIFTHGYWLPPIDGFPLIFSSVSIGNDVWLPWECFINPGINIGNNVVVGARSLINKSIPSFSLAVGSPAKVIKNPYPDSSNINKIQTIKDYLKNYFISKSINFKIIEDMDIKVRIQLEKDNLEIIIDESDHYLENKNIIYFKNKYIEDQKFEDNIIYSLFNYKISKYVNLPDILKNWLNYSRIYGLRFYPIDEIDEEF